MKKKIYKNLNLNHVRYTAEKNIYLQVIWAKIFALH